jgi:hypothetical protein
MPIRPLNQPLSRIRLHNDECGISYKELEREYAKFDAGNEQSDYNTFLYGISLTFPSPSPEVVVHQIDFFLKRIALLKKDSEIFLRFNRGLPDEKKVLDLLEKLPNVEVRLEEYLSEARSALELLDQQENQGAVGLGRI